MENLVQKCILAATCPWGKVCDKTDWWTCVHTASELTARRAAKTPLEELEHLFDRTELA